MMEMFTKSSLKWGRFIYTLAIIGDGFYYIWNRQTIFIFVIFLSFVHYSGINSYVLFEVDGTGEMFEDDFPSYPIYPNQQLHVGGLPDGNVKREAMARLNDNGIFVNDKFYGCMKEMTIETTDEYNSYEVGKYYKKFR